MTNAEKLINDLERCRTCDISLANLNGYKEYMECEYTTGVYCGKDKLICEVIKELQNRVPVEMELEGGGSTWWYVCPECRRSVDPSDKFCKCGQALKR